jgi:hypothetical protein
VTGVQTCALPICELQVAKNDLLAFLYLPRATLRGVLNLSSSRVLWVTVGGAVGRVTKVYEQYVGVEMADNLEIKVQKTSIQSVLPKGTIGSIK